MLSEAAVKVSEADAAERAGDRDPVPQTVRMAVKRDHHNGGGEPQRRELGADTR